jgi:hypothetical protein
MIRGIKIVWCWIFGHDHQAAGDYSMCWRCGQIKRSANSALCPAPAAPANNERK